MSTHDSIIRYGQDRSWRARWRRLAWRSLHSVVPWRLGTRPVRAGRRERRRLSVIECALTKETPRLAAMFEMFAHLAAGESCEGAERLPWLTRPRPARRPRARRVHVALLLAFASLVALCVTLSVRVSPRLAQLPGLHVVDVASVARIVTVARLPCRGGGGRLRAGAHGRLPRVPYIQQVGQAEET